MKIPFIYEDSLGDIKTNIGSYVTEFQDGTINDEDGILRNLEFGETEHELPEFKLKTLDDFDGEEKEYFEANKSMLECENAKILHSHMKGLSRSEATDERIWVALGLKHFYDYVISRCDKVNESTIKNRFFFGESSKRRSIVRNSLSKLWWIAELTYVETAENPYELTEFVCKDSDRVATLLERNISNNFSTLHPLIRALKDTEEHIGKKLSRELIREVAKYVNMLGGIYILDCLSYDEIYDKVMNKITELLNRAEQAS